MPDVQEYPFDQLPKHWFYQVISFLRICHTEGFIGDLQYRNWISSPDTNPVHLVIGHDDVLIAHAEILSKTLVHCGSEYKVYGLSGVLTYPAFRRQGYGRKIVRYATGYIQAQPDTDIGVLTCDHHNVAFFEKCGWSFSGSQLLIGEPREPAVCDERLGLVFVSEKARQQRSDIETVPMYFGEDVW